MAEKENPKNAEHGHEHKDVDIRAIAKFGIGLLLCVLAAALLMKWMFDWLAARQARMEQPPSPLAQPAKLPPEPRLQVAPAENLKKLRAEENALLRRYEWVDADAGIVRIPIERAMELLSERGLPARQSEDGRLRMENGGTKP